MSSETFNMWGEPKTTKEYVARLRSRDWRERSIIVFRGTGLNAWHYYPFLKNFSLRQLSEFAAIYGVSGGAAMVWFYVLAQCGLFHATGQSFDRIIRSTMNASGLRTRLRRVLRGQPPYDEEDIRRFLSSLPATEARHLTFAESRLPNFTVVAHDKRNDGLLLIDARTDPKANVLDVLSQAGTPRKLPREGTTQCADLQIVSDFDFASRSVKRAFQLHLETHQAPRHVYQVNMLRDGVENETVFVKVCAYRMPRWSQAIDVALLFLGLPNFHYRAAFEKTYPLVSD